MNKVEKVDHYPNLTSAKPDATLKPGIVNAKINLIGKLDNVGVNDFKEIQDILLYNREEECKQLCMCRLLC